MKQPETVRKIHLTLICGALFLLPLIWTPLSKESFRIPKESIFESVLLFLFFAWMVHALAVGRFKLRLTAPLVLFGGFLLINALFLPQVRNIDYGYRDIFRLGGGVLLYLYLISLIEEEVEVEWVGKMLIHGCVLMAVLGLLQYHGGLENGKAVGGWLGVPQPLRSLYAEDRPFSTSGNPIVLSENVILVAPLVVYYLLHAKNWLPKIFYFSLFVVLAASVVTSGTKAAWAGFAASLVLYALFYVIIKRREIFAAIKPYALGVSAGCLLFAVATVLLTSGNDDFGRLKALFFLGLAGLGVMVALPKSATAVKSSAMIASLVLVSVFYAAGPSQRRSVVDRLRTTTNVGSIVLPDPQEVYPEFMTPPDDGAGVVEKTVSKVQSGFGTFMATPSTQQRLMLWRVTRMAVSEAPFFGVGLGNFCYYFTMKQGTFYEDPHHEHLVSLIQGLARQAHNEILQIWLENGTGGLLIFSAAFLSLFLLAFVSIVRTQNMLLIPLTCGLVATVIEGQAQFCMHVSPTTFLILGVAALVDRQIIFNKPLLPSVRIPLPKLDVWALILVIPLYLLWSYSGFYFWKAELGSVLTRRGETALEDASRFDMARNTALNNLQQARTSNDQKGIADYERTATLHEINRDKKLSEAEFWNFKGLSVEPENEELWFNLGLVYLRRASYLQGPGHEETRRELHAKAKAAYLRTVQILDYGVARYNLAIAYWATGEYDEAVENLKRANFFDPFYSRTYQLLVDYLFRMHRFDEALVWIEKGKKALPPGPDHDNLMSMEQTVRRGIENPNLVPYPAGYTPPAPPVPSSAPVTVSIPAPAPANASQ